MTDWINFIVEVNAEMAAKPVSQQGYLQRTEVIENPICSVWLGCVPDAVT